MRYDFENHMNYRFFYITNCELLLKSISTLAHGSKISVTWEWKWVHVYEFDSCNLLVEVTLYLS